MEVKEIISYLKGVDTDKLTPEQRDAVSAVLEAHQIVEEYPELESELYDADQRRDLKALYDKIVERVGAGKKGRTYTLNVPRAKATMRAKSKKKQKNSEGEQAKPKPKAKARTAKPKTEPKPRVGISVKRFKPYPDDGKTEVRATPVVVPYIRRFLKELQVMSADSAKRALISLQRGELMEKFDKNTPNVDILTAISKQYHEFIKNGEYTVTESEIEDLRAMLKGTREYRTQAFIKRLSGMSGKILTEKMVKQLNTMAARIMVSAKPSDPYYEKVGMIAQTGLDSNLVGKPFPAIKVGLTGRKKKTAKRREVRRY